MPGVSQEARGKLQGFLESKCQPKIMWRPPLKAQQAQPPPFSLIRTSVCRPGCHFSNCWSFPVEGRLRLSRGRLGKMKGINPSPSIGSPTPSLPQGLSFTKSFKLWVEGLPIKKSHLPSSFERLLRSRCCGNP